MENSRTIKKQQETYHRFLLFYFPKGILVFLLLPLREDDFINREVNHHLHAAVDDGNQDVVQRRREELLAQRHINPHQKAAHNRDKHKRHHVPRNLIPHVAFGFERDIALHREIDALCQKQRNGKRCKVAHAAGCVAGDGVVEHIGIHRPHVQVDQLAGDAAPVGQIVEQPWQKGQQQVLQHCDKQRKSVEFHKLCHELMLFRESVPVIFYCFHSLPHSCADTVSSALYSPSDAAIVTASPSPMRTMASASP